MRELQHDANQWQAVMSNVDAVTGKAQLALKRNDFRAVHIHLEQIREGLRLLCELAGVKLAS